MWLVAGLLCSAIAAAGQAAYAALAGPALLSLGDESALLLAAVAVGVALIRGAALIGEGAWLGSAAALVGRDLRIRLSEHLLNLPLPFFRVRATGDLLSRLLEDCRAVEASYLHGRLALWRESAATGALLLVACFAEPRLFTMGMLFVPFAWAAAAIAARQTRTAATDERASTGRLAARVAQLLGAMRDVKAAGSEDVQLKHVRQEADTALRATERRLRARAMLPAINEAGAAFGLVGAVALGRWLEVPTERLVSFFTAMVLLYKPLKGVGQALGMLSEAAPSRHRIDEILCERREREGGTQVPSLRDRITVRDVCYRYDSAARPALIDVEFAVRVGEIVALTGPSGAGKTTLAHLVGGLLEPTSGEIRWDELPQRKASLRSWRSAVAFVGQNPLLLDADIRQLCPDSEVMRTLGIASLLHRRSGERGGLLSAGEAQRVALAMALARDTSLIILDEPTAPLDADNEQLLALALRHASKRAAILIVSHRQALAQAADRVLRLEQGRMLAEPASPWSGGLGDLSLTGRRDRPENLPS